MKNTEILTQTQENIITLQELKDYLEITNDDQDAALENLIDAASAYIKNQTGYQWVETKHKETIDGVGNNSLVMSQRPIQSVSLLEVNNIELTSGEYVIYNKQGIITRRKQEFPEGLQNIVVEYTGGYSDIPSDITQACKELIKAKTNNDGYEGLSAYSIGDESIEFGDNNIPSQTAETLASYSKKRW